MKRTIILSLLLLAVLVTVSACSKPPVSGGNTNANQNASSTSKVPGGRGSRMPDFGQPDKNPDIRGVVKTITGNEAVILKVDMQAGRGNRTASSTPDANNASGTGPTPSVSLNGAGNGGGRNFGGGGPGGQGAGGAAVDRTAMLARLKAMSTGEDTVVIPVGIKMLKSSTDTSTKQRTMVEATLADITPDKTITIWLNSAVTDKKVAEFVLIN